MSFHVNIHKGDLLEKITLIPLKLTDGSTIQGKLNKGDLIAEFDMDAIKAAGLETITPVIICNSDDYSQVEKIIGKEVKVGETIMKLTK